MFCVTLKVLSFRSVCVLRQRWGLTLFYWLFPLILCLVTVNDYGKIPLAKYESHIQEHGERSLLQFPKMVNCTGDKCQLKVVVCPGGAKERDLMSTVVSVWRDSDSASSLDIRYVDEPTQMDDILNSSDPYSNNTRGLHFIEISSSKLEYKIRPMVLPSVYGILYDWWDYATRRKFPSPMFRGPRLTDVYFNNILKLPRPNGDDIAIHYGFLPLQVAVDKAYIKTYFPHVSKDWILSSFPYPSYYELPEELRRLLSQRVGLIFTQYMLMMGIIVMISVFVSYNIGDKISGIREWLCLNGANRWLVNLSWLISFCLQAAILAVIEVGILKIPTQNGPTIKYMSVSVLTLVLIIHSWLSLCWAHLFSAALKKRILCILIIVAYWIFSPALQWIPPDNFIMQGLLAALPNAGMVLIFKSFQEFDGAETVLDLFSLKTYPIHYLPVGTLLLIMFATMLLLILLGCYADLVMPGPYGRAKPWYLFEKKETIHDHVRNKESPTKEKYFEEISSQDPIGLECVGISKFFRTKTIPWWRFHKAVSNVNMKIPKNKITVLLGPNGAGKTTLFSILCGMYSPSIGHCYTEDYDVFQGGNIKKFRKVLGHCPQSNLLMDELTARQHLIIFGLLKGLSKYEADKRSKSWINRFEMDKFENVRVGDLSGGTKRKLCLAIAMTGDPQYLLLDEPSAGLDIKSRRTFWNILFQEKSKRTVVMSTHDMDEAEVLGDHIALVVDGELVGYGSSSFLKKQLETGYKLNCTFNEKDEMNFFRFTENFNRSISILYETRNTVTLGFPQNKPKMIPNFMKNLESEFGNDIATSLTHVTMNDVFINVQSGSKTGNSPNNVSVLNEYDIVQSCCNFRQTEAIFKKRIEWLYNQSLMTVIILLLILPITSIELGLYFTKIIVSPKNHTADLKLTMNEYRGKTAFITTRDDDITNALRWSMKNSDIMYKEVDRDMVDFLGESAKKDLFEFRSGMVFAFDSANEASGVPTAYYSRNAFHSAPIAYSALINAILHGNANITTHNSPYFPFVQEKDRPSCSEFRLLAIVMLLIFLGPVLLMVGSHFIIFPHTEKKALFKHLQLMTGLLPWVYWISNLMFDMIIFLISMLLIIIIMAVDDIGLFSNSTVILALISVLLLYGISIIILAYAFSFGECSTSTLTILFISFPASLVLLYVITLLIVYFKLKILILSYKYLYFLPWPILMVSLTKIFFWASQARACYKCEDAGACAYISSYPLVGWLKDELVYFLILSLAYFTFILAMDHGFGRKIKPMVNRMCHGEIEDARGETNPDVAKEKERVRELEMDEEGDHPELICNGLGKKYSRHITAVRDVTFAADRGNLFGLLGANGSGKSTTLGMLSGVISPSKGTATVRGQWELSDCEYKYIKHIGYCPQFGGLLPGLSGRNTLRLFARLRGLKSPNPRDSHVDGWIQALDMVSLADRPCEQYSTGNQRKLSFAIAMIGGPSVVLLDEPTTGIDPFVRSRIWDIFSRENSSQAVIISSHAMSECEAICDRLTFMTNGEMNCLGSTPELKNKLGKSCTLYIKLQNDITPQQLDNIIEKLLRESRFSRYAELQEKRTNALKINVKLEKIKTYDVFSDMLNIKDGNSSIEDFTLTESPLEEAFMPFIEKHSISENKRV